MDLLDARFVKYSQTSINTYGRLLGKIEYRSSLTAYSIDLIFSLYIFRHQID